MKTVIYHDPTSPRVVLALAAFVAISTGACALGESSASQSAASSRAVHPMFLIGDRHTAPFPSNLYTVSDQAQLTGRRVNLAKPDCAQRPTDCQDIDVLNTLDGFNIAPQLSIPFDGLIDVTSVTSNTVFLVRLDGGSQDQDTDGASPTRVGINQVVFDEPSRTLLVESDEILNEHATYALIVTRGVLDSTGAPIGAATEFQTFRHDMNFGSTHSADLKDYRHDLLKALRASGIAPDEVAVASVFTTRSVSTNMLKIRDRIKSDTPAEATFTIGPNGSRAVFALSSVAGLEFQAQNSLAPTFMKFDLPVSFLRVVPNAIGTMAFGKFQSPQYENSQGVIPKVPTGDGDPQILRTEDLYFDLYLPSGPKPDSGWPIVIFGHGTTSLDVPYASKYGLLQYASVLASHGIASIAINAAYHGWGNLSNLTVRKADGSSVTMPSGGRAIDQDGDGIISTNREGATAARPFNVLFASDTWQQTAIDLMQLVRVIQVGMDVDGDGSADFDTSRILFTGRSAVAWYAFPFMALEPDVQVGWMDVSCAGTLEWWRLAPNNRPGVSKYLGSRIPSLINTKGPNPIDPRVLDFKESKPLRNHPPVINTTPGAIAIQEALEWNEWAAISGDAAGYARQIRAEPLPGVAPKRVVVGFAKGDMNNTNPATTAIVRYGDMPSRTSYFRNDLAYAMNPNFGKQPHGYSTNITHTDPQVREVAFQAQHAIAKYLESDGAAVIDADGPGPLFEAPIAGPLPEETNVIP